MDISMPLCTRELIDIAHEEHLSIWWDRFEERVRQEEIEHRGLIYHEGLRLQGIVLVMPELHPCRVERQHPVDGFGFHAGQLRKTLGGTPCWSGKQNAFAHGTPQRNNGTRGKRLPAAGSAGQHQDARGSSQLYGAPLLCGEMNIPLLCERVDPAPHARQIDLNRLLGKARKSFRESHFGVVKRRRVADALFGQIAVSLLNNE